MLPSTDRDLDDVDIVLLAAIRDDGRATVQALANKVELSTAATSVRLARLKERGAYRGVHAEIDEQWLGYEFCAYMLLRVADTSSRMEVTGRLFSIPEVTEVAWITGEYDVLLTCWGKDRLHLEAIIEAIIAAGARTTTMLVLGDVYRKPAPSFELPQTERTSDPDLPRRIAFAGENT